MASREQRLSRLVAKTCFRGLYVHHGVLAADGFLGLRAHIQNLALRRMWVLEFFGRLREQFSHIKHYHGLVQASSHGGTIV